MKHALFCLLALTVLLNFSCTKNVESSPIPAIEKSVETPSPPPLPEKFERRFIRDEMEQVGRFSNLEEDVSKTFFKVQGFSIKKDVVQKTDEIDSPVTGKL